MTQTVGVSAPLPKYRLVRAPQPATMTPRLDDAQAQVVAHLDGPLLVLGGPGSGKTTCVVESVAARVAQGVSPDRILVLTFGRKAAASLRQQIQARIGGQNGTGQSGTGRPGTGLSAMTEPLVRTFPAYAFGLLRMVAAEYGEPPPRLLTGAEQDALIRDMLVDRHTADGWPETLRQAVPTRAFAAQLRDLLLRTAERGIDSAELADLGHQHDRPDWVAAARFAREYGQVLALREASTRGSVAYDQAELLRGAAAALRDDPAMLARERDRCSFIYVDELADTDPAQLDLLELIAGGGAHVVGLADPDSSTFAFRGSDPTGLRDFADRFTTVAGAAAPRVLLTRSYRCGPTLLSATRRVAARLRGPARHRAMISAIADPDLSHPSPPLLEVCTLGSSASEAAYVAYRLRQAHLEHGIAWSRMAVIVRSVSRNDTSLRRALIQAGVAVFTSADDLALAAQPAVAPFLLLLRKGLHPSTLDESSAVELLHSPFGGADPYTERQLRQGLRDLARMAGDQRGSGELLVEALRDPAELALVDHRWAAPARALANALHTVRISAANPAATAEDVLWAVWKSSGLADRWAAASARGGRLGEAADRDLDAMMALYDAAARFTDRLPGARVDAFLDYVLEQQLPTDTLAAAGARGEAVRILTAHAAKGLQWDVVVVPGVQEGVWPDLRLRGSVLGSEKLVDVVAGRDGGTASQVSALLDEERRLFYVAITRARRSLLVTAVDASSTGSGGEEQPSRFLSELGQPSALAMSDLDLAPSTEDGALFDLGSPPTEPDRGGETGAAAQPELAVGVLRRPLTLAALVAQLRTVAADEEQPAARRSAAAEQLAMLADADVPGADPDQWWGLRELSDDRDLVDADAPVIVTPSTVESVLRCGLRWLLERHGGSDPPSAKQSIGNLVHAAAMLVQEADFDPEAVRAFVDDRFGAIELPARWLGTRERTRSAAMVDKLLTWLAANPRDQLAVEQDFRASLPAGERGIVLRGRVDRLEADEEGRLVVVDLKTGASAPTLDDTLVHPQLAAYQVAVRSGAFAQGTRSGGAEIVAVGTSSVKATVRVQPPIDEADDPEWADELVRRAATAMAGSAFRAVVNDTCAYCAIAISCPVSGKGRQVQPA